MGNLLRLLSREEDPIDDDIFVDFENAEPTDDELEVYLEVEKLLAEAKDILNALRNYRGAGSEIRDAITQPKDEELQQKALDALVPSLKKLKLFFDFSTRLVLITPKLLSTLCSTSMTPYEHLKTQQSLVKQFAELLDFVLSFDDLKMYNPCIQNDLSYYRRAISRTRLVTGDGSSPFDTPEVEVSEDMANLMSLFYAHATPMLRVLTQITSTFLDNKDNKEIDFLSVTEILSLMARICHKMIEKKEFIERFTKKEETIFFILRVMVGVIILYDHVHPSGVFVKSSHIDLKGSIRVLKDQPTSESLLNALRYTTKHLNDINTPKTIRSLLLFC